jgi:hypothetical protein
MSVLAGNSSIVGWTSGIRAASWNPRLTRSCFAASMNGYRSSTALPPWIVIAEDRPASTG